jgi:hypothetical protein
MGRVADQTDFDSLLGLREWLTNASDEALAQAVPQARVSRSDMLAKLDELIEMARNGGCWP